MLIDFNLESDLQKLIDCDALEVNTVDDASTVFIPYMLNDALECYFELKECTIQGEWDAEYDGEVSISLLSNNGRDGISINQGGMNVVTIWYGSIKKHLELYQYHRIAHVWVKGQERWRRLVYIIGTMSDKLNFMGPELCNEIELELIPLMGFAPFRYFSPINESLDEYYSNTKNGISAMFEISKNINDDRLCKLVVEYTKLFSNDRLNGVKIRRMAKILSKNDDLYDYINKRISEASLHYQKREYDEADLAKISRLREKAVSRLLERGFVGEYPHYVKNKKRITLYEEHPFMMSFLEYDNYDFNINEIAER